MKKLQFLFIGLASLLVLGSCTSIDRLDFSEEMGTPENSVVFYGYIVNDTIDYFSQMDPNFPADYQEFVAKGFMVDSNYIISKPVKPGSTYALEYSKGMVSYGNLKYFWNDYFPMNVKTVRFKVPKEPGLYYIGYLNGEDIVRKNELVPFKSLFMPDEASLKIQILEKVKIKYKDTVWEAAADAEIQKLED